MFRKLLLFALVGLAVAAPSTSNVNSKLSSTLAREGRANIAISFKGDTSAILARVNNMRFNTRGAKATFAKSQLHALKTASQSSAASLLSEGSVAFRSSWINNRMYVKNASPEIVAALSALPEVSEIREESVAQIIQPFQSNVTIQAEWGVEKIEAPQAWEESGVNGGGIVVAAIDTGVRGTHTVLQGNKRSSHAWFDPYEGTQAPVDSQGHGTHVMGTIAGQNGVGVAPGAEWIACAGCNSQGYCYESEINQCGEFVACPTQPDGSGENCDLMADVVSNSWGGGQDDPTHTPMIEAWRAFGIIPVFAIGNEGLPIFGCETASSPGDHPDVIGVGATNNADGLAWFSSRGPAVTGILKPDVSAPGVSVHSAWHTSDTAMNNLDGTSMACPHVSGLVALLLSKNPNLTFDQVKEALQNNADRDVGAVLPCGGTSYDEWPNNLYGHGRVNARKAVRAV